MAAVALMVQKPLVRRWISFGEWDFGVPSEVVEALNVEKLLIRSVRSAGIPASLASITNDVGDNMRQFGDGEVFAGSDIDRPDVVVTVQQKVARTGEVIDVQELPSGSSGSPARHLPDAITHCLVESANHGGQDVAIPGVEVIAGPVQICRHRADILKSPNRGELRDTRQLRHPIALVRFLERPGEQCVLADRLLGELRIDAARTQEQKSSDAAGDSTVE